MMSMIKLTLLWKLRLESIIYFANIFPITNRHVYIPGLYKLALLEITTNEPSICALLSVTT